MTALPRLPAPARQGRGSSAGDNGRAGRSQVLAHGSCPHCRPHQTRSCPSLSCAWLQDPVPPRPGEGEQPKPSHWAQFFSGLKKKKKKCSKTKPAAASPPAPLCHGGQTGGGLPWPAPSPGAGDQGRRAMAPGPPPCHPSHLCTLPAFLQLLNGFCDTVLHFLVPDRADHQGGFFGATFDAFWELFKKNKQNHKPSHVW